MNAKEMLLKHTPKDCYWEDMDNLTNTPVSCVEKAMKEYAKQACKEQREICYKEARKYGLSSYVKNAPEPEML